MGYGVKKVSYYFMHRINEKQKMLFNTVILVCFLYHQNLPFRYQSAGSSILRNHLTILPPSERCFVLGH